MSNSPFGSDTQKYWDERYSLFLRFDDGIEIDKEALFSVMPEKYASLIAKKTKGDTVLEAFGCVGGSAIGFALENKKVTAIELNKDRYNMGKRNVEIYGVENNVTFIHSDIKDFLDHNEYLFDTIFLDPPWGGPDYYRRESLYFDDFIISGLTMQDMAKRSGASYTVMRLPKNFDFDKLIKDYPEAVLEHYTREDGRSYFSCFWINTKEFDNK